MKKLTTIFLLISFATFAKEEPAEDSLIANIGKKAKVIFCAENKADLNEIAKYDLNKLFAEVRKRSEKNFSNNEEVTLREVDENLKNREVNTTVSPKKWFKNMNLNLFVGGSPFILNTDVVGKSYLNLNSIPQSIVRDIFTIEGKNTLMLGIAGFYDKSLFLKKRSELSLKYGIGFDLINSKFNIKRSTTIIGLNEPEDPVDYFTNEYENAKIVSTNLYTSFIPTFSLRNWKGQKTFNIGIGFKVAINFNNLTFKENYHRGSILYLKNSPRVFIQNPTLQTAFVANIGYKYINAFFQIIPNHTIIKSFIGSEYRPFDNTIKQVSKNSYIIGLRFGK